MKRNSPSNWTPICEECGNPAGNTGICQHCQWHLDLSLQEQSPKRIKVCLLKAGNPTVVEAMDRFWDAYNDMLVADIRIMVLVHGYGSNGTGGEIRDQVRRALHQLEATGKLRLAIHGESFPKHPEAKALFEKFGELRRQIPKRGNDGVTVVLT